MFWGRPPHPTLCHICVQLRSRGEAIEMLPKTEVLWSACQTPRRDTGHQCGSSSLLNGSQWALAVWSGWQAFLALDCASRPGQAGKGWGGSEKVIRLITLITHHLSPFAFLFFAKSVPNQVVQCFLAFPPGSVAGLGHTDSGSSASRSARLVRGRPICIHLHPFASQVDKVKTTERHVHDARSCSTWNLLKSDALGILALQLFNPSWIRIVLFENRHVLAWSRSCFRAGWRDKQCGWEKRGSHTLSISKGAVGVRRWLNVMTVRDGMWLKTEKNCRFVSSRASQVLNLQNLVPGVHYRQKLQQIGKIWQVFRYV